MTYWVAVSSGALDVRDHELGSQGYELVITPQHPGAPQFLWGDGAVLWRNATESSIDDAHADDDTREALRDLEALGLLERADWPRPPSTRVSTPWLNSFQHELVYALLANAARRAGIDILFIKGPVLHQQGLRLKKHSGDVDCWIRPEDEAALVAAMAAWGWTPVHTAFDGTAVTHSRTLVPTAWGCEIDVHTRFPGMTADAATAFERVLESAVERTFAGASVLVPKQAAHAVIYGLHELRPVPGRPVDASRVEHAVDALRTAGQDAATVADDLGAGFVLGGALRQSFPQLDLSSLDVTEPIDWHWRSIASVPRRQISALRMLPIRQRAAVLLRLLWPSADASRRTREASADGTAGLVRVKIKRINDGVLALFRGR